VCEVDTAISDFSVGPSRSRPDFDEVK
jgi:hypothetical protein